MPVETFNARGINNNAALMAMHASAVLRTYDDN